MFTLASLGFWGALTLAIDLVAIVGLLRGRNSHGHKILWIFLILIMPCFGVLLYYLFGRRSSDA